MSLGDLLVGIYELDGFEGRVTYAIQQFMNDLEKKSRTRSIFIAGWETMEDELRFVLMLRGDFEKCEQFATEVEAGLADLLKNLFGLRIKKLVVSRVTDVTPPPEILTDLRLELKKIYDFLY